MFHFPVFLYTPKTLCAVLLKCGSLSLLNLKSAIFIIIIFTSIKIKMPSSTFEELSPPPPPSGLVSRHRECGRPTNIDDHHYRHHHQHIITITITIVIIVIIVIITIIMRTEDLDRNLLLPHRHSNQNNENLPLARITTIKITKIIPAPLSTCLRTATSLLSCISITRASLGWWWWLSWRLTLLKFYYWLGFDDQIIDDRKENYDDDDFDYDYNDDDYDYNDYDDNDEDHKVRKNDLLYMGRSLSEPLSLLQHFHV